MCKCTSYFVCIECTKANSDLEALSWTSRLYLVETPNGLDLAGYPEVTPEYLRSQFKLIKGGKSSE